MEPRIERAYAVLTGDDDTDRACKAIPEEACHHLPRNYFLNLVSGSAQKLAEQIAAPNLVIPWLMGALGAPAAMVGWLMPIRQTGALLPQLMVSGRIRAQAVRKWYWTVPAFIAAGCLVAMAFASLELAPVAAGWVILALVAVFAVTRGIASVAFQDVLGKTIDKGVRGRLLSHRSVLGGALAVAAGLAIGRGGEAEMQVVELAWLLAAGAGLWLIAGSLFAMTTERPGATEGGRDPIGEFRAGWMIVRGSTAFRRYLLARGLLLSVEVAAPFFVLFGQDLLGADATGLGAMLTAVALANVFGSAFWGRHADASARMVQLAGGVIGVLAVLYALGFAMLPEAWRGPWGFSVAFLLLGFSEAGVRLGRKTWIVDVAPDGDRATWVAFANTLIGLVTLAAGLLGLVAQAAGPGAAIASIGVIAALGVAVTLFMPAGDRIHP